MTVTRGVIDGDDISPLVDSQMAVDRSGRRVRAIVTAARWAAARIRFTDLGAAY